MGLALQSTTVRSIHALEHLSSAAPGYVVQLRGCDKQRTETFGYNRPAFPQIPRPFKVLLAALHCFNENNDSGSLRTPLNTHRVAQAVCSVLTEKAVARFKICKLKETAMDHSPQFRLPHASELRTHPRSFGWGMQEPSRCLFFPSVAPLPLLDTSLILLHPQRHEEYESCIPRFSQPSYGTPQFLGDPKERQEVAR